MKLPKILLFKVARGEKDREGEDHVHGVAGVWLKYVVDLFLEGGAGVMHSVDFTWWDGEYISNLLEGGFSLFT